VYLSWLAPSAGGAGGDGGKGGSAGAGAGDSASAAGGAEEGFYLTDEYRSQLLQALPDDVTKPRVRRSSAVQWKPRAAHFSAATPWRRTRCERRLARLLARCVGD
jgi:hypothetical protein